jgi:hypothetical protein
MTTLSIRRRFAARRLAPTRQATTLACAAAVATLAARPAEAQFKKLKDLGKAAVKGAVEGTAEGAAKQAVGDGTREAKPATVKFTDNLLEITDARLAQFIKGFDAEIAARPAADKQYQQQMASYETASRLHEARMAEYDRAVAAYEKRKAAYQACADDIEKKHEKDSQKDRAASENAAEQIKGEITEDKEKKLQALADRMRAAQARGDQAAVRAISDTVMREMQAAMAIAQQGNVVGQRMMARSAEMQAELKKCPAPGEEPKRPDMPSSADPEQARRITEDAAAKASGLTAAQYGLMKERIETYVHLKGRTGNTQYIFAAGELEALSKQLGELQKRPDLVEPSYWYPGKK